MNNQPLNGPVSNSVNQSHNSGAELTQNIRWSREPTKTNGKISSTVFQAAELQFKPDPGVLCKLTNVSEEFLIRGEGSIRIRHTNIAEAFVGLFASFCDISSKPW